MSINSTYGPDPNVSRQQQENVLATHEKLQNDLPYFARNILKIEDKTGALLPFKFNKAQMYLHERLERQLAETGMVRALILKGRQQGCSTYVAARFYHKTTRNHNRSSFILSHQSSTTDALFSMVARFHKHCPEPVKPSTPTANSRELEFSNDSKYTVGTAGSAQIGRGFTTQYFHGSEVAFYKNTDELETGILQSVADVPNTEIILESTANGVGNYFHKACMDALSGNNDYILIFIPWFWQDEYRRKLPDDGSFQLEPEEEQLKKLYNLDDEQLYWRRRKIANMREGEWKFKQEYPCNVEEAFQSSGESLIRPMDIAKARKAKIIDPKAAVVIGCDPARKGDRTAIAIRQGRHLREMIVYHEMDEMMLAGILATLIDRHGAQKCFVDVALGYGTIDRLKELGFGHIVTGVHFGEKAIQSDAFINKRAEMAIALRDWIHDGGVSIPDDDDLATDLGCIPDFKQNSRSLIFIENKDNIRKVYGKSPDLFDAAMLTFAFPVKAKSEIPHRNSLQHKTQMSKRGSPLTTLADRRRKNKDI